MAHLTAAANEKVFGELFKTLRDNFTLDESDSGTFGPFTAAYHVKLHLEGGSVDLRGDNTIKIEELDIKWDVLDLTLGFDIPEICTPSFCIIPTPFGCALEFPEWCIFDDNPDISITLPLGGITSELTVVASLLTKYFIHPERTPGMDAWDAQDTLASPDLDGKVEKEQRFDTFYVGTIKGVGRIYQQTFVDTYSKWAATKLYTTKTPIPFLSRLDKRAAAFSFYGPIIK